MDIWENIFVALQGLIANKLRSGLTMLGIIIGVLAVIVGTSIAQGSQDDVLKKIQALGSNTVTIFSGQQRRGAISFGGGSQQSLTIKDVEAVLKNCPTVMDAVPTFQRSAQVKYGNQNTNCNIVCTGPSYPTIRNFRIETGRFITEKDVRSKRKVCIIGKTTAKNLFADALPIGRSVRIKGINFKIIGLMALKGTAMFGDPDDQVYVPVTTGMKMVFGVDNISQISAQVRDLKLSDQAVKEIETAMRKSHRLLASAEDDFVVRTQAEFMATQEQAGQAFTFLLSGFGAVALLVGGIGIMNIMLVSVTERTREIGIRKAVGARNNDILFQFLIESMTLSVMGGLIGIIAGVGVAGVIGTALGWPTLVSPLWVGISFCSSATIGVVFGVYPAWKAAQLDPIEALRYQ